MTVPIGGASVSAQVANGGSAATVTVPAGTYFLTAAGGVPGLIATLQTQLNTKHELMGFPRTAAVMDTVVGGDWTNGSGWLCQEASGSLAPVFGAVTLTASGTPTYRNDGIKDGDYAVGFDANTEFFSGGDVHDIDATDDLIVAWVGYHALASSATTSLISRRSGLNAGWLVRRATGGVVEFAVRDASTGFAASVAHPVAAWYVGLAVLDRTANRIRIAVCPLGGSASVSSAVDVSAIGSLTNAAAFKIGNQDGATNGDTDFLCSAAWVVSGASVASGLSSGISAAVTSLAAAINSAWSVSLSDTTGQVTIDWTGYSTPTWSLSWTSTTLRDVLGFDASITNATTATTGAASAHGVWCPNAAMDVGESDPRRAPRVTDLRTTTSPTGRVLGLVGPSFRRHRNITWELVPEFRVWEASADVPNNTWETFFADTQLGEHAWFGVSSPIQIYDHAGNRVGQDADVSGWQITGVDSIDPKRVGDWTGLWTVTLPAIVSSG